MIRSAPVDPASQRRLLPRRPAAFTAVVCAVGLCLIFYTQLGSGPGTAAHPLVVLPGKAGAWAAMTVAVAVQSLPFLVLGVAVSAAIATFAPMGLLQRWSPGHDFLKVPAASFVAIALPGCECSSVPVARSLLRRGLSPAGALSFMIASPSLNPVVIVSTAVAFYMMPQMAWARFAAAFIAVVCAGWLWLLLGSKGALDQGGEGADCCAGHGAGDGCCGSGDPRSRRRWHTFQAAALHDLTQAGAFLVLGAMIAGVIKVFIPASWFISLSDSPLLTIGVMAAFAIVLSLCSEADAFVAASFGAVSPTAQLVFLVVGPVVDIKLCAMQAGAFGCRFVLRFVPIALLCTVGSAMLVGLAVFGSL